jgi:hypothetical protein
MVPLALNSKKTNIGLSCCSILFIFLNTLSYKYNIFQNPDAEEEELQGMK